MLLLRPLVLLPLVVAVIIAGALPWYERLNEDRVWEGRPPPATFFKMPLMSRPQSAIAYRWLQGAQIEPTLVEREIERALLARPLSPDNWLLAARVKYKLGKSDEAARLAERAQKLGPTRAYLLWDLAMFWMAYSDLDKTIALLHDYLLAAPSQVNKVLLVAYRFEDDKAALLNKLVPLQLAEGYAYNDDYYAAQIMRTALRLKNPELAQLAWSRFQHRAVTDNPNANVIKAYQQFLIGQNLGDQALAVWQETQGTKDQAFSPGNAGFEQEISTYGFGWRLNKQKGVQYERSFDQAIEGDYSLKITLDGTENINLSFPRRTLIVEAGQTYRLSIYWKGEQITTRANPFFELVYQTQGKTKAMRSEPQRGSWNWQRVEFEFEVPPGTRFAELRLRRWPSQALDKLISGVLYIDDLRLEKQQ